MCFPSTTISNYIFLSVLTRLNLPYCIFRSGIYIVIIRIFLWIFSCAIVILDHVRNMFWGSFFFPPHCELRTRILLVLMRNYVYIRQYPATLYIKHRYNLMFTRPHVTISLKLPDCINTKSSEPY